jgi:glycosyltransferase involved in cell wall biosynthesis
MTKYSNTCKVSIIVAVYCVEKYLKRCLDSIIGQTFLDFECIIVDDCSPDNSPAICDDYAKNDNRIIVFHKQQNEGLPQARKTGFNISKGQYILFVDGDDYLENTMIEKIYYKAKHENLDIVCCDIYVDKHGSIRYNKQRISGSDKTTIIKQLLTGSVWHNVWNKLIKNNICKKIIFPVTSNGEDWVIIIQAIYYSINIGYLHEALYHYCFNSMSITSDKSKKLLGYCELYKSIGNVYNFLLEKYHNDISIFEPELSDIINKTKLPFLLIRNIRNISKLYDLYPESNKNIFNKSMRLSPIYRYLFYFAAHNTFFPLKLFDVFEKPGACIINTIRSAYKKLLPTEFRLKILKLRKVEDDNYI